MLSPALEDHTGGDRGYLNSLFPIDWFVMDKSQLQILQT